MQQMPNRKEPSGIKSRCMVCGDKFEFISASFVSICNDCRKHHENTANPEEQKIDLGLSLEMETTKHHKAHIPKKMEVEK